MKHSNWTEYLDAYVIANADSMDDAEIALQLSFMTGDKFTAAAVQVRRCKMGYARETGRALSARDRNYIKWEVEEGRPIAELAEEFGVSVAYVSNVAAGRE